MRKQIVNLDASTGQVMDGIIAYVQPRRQNAFEGWVAVAQTALQDLSKSHLTGTDFRVLMACLARLEWKNMLPMHQTEMAHELGLVPSNFNRSLKKLIDFGVIEKQVDSGVRLYRLNPHFGWKGSAKHHREAVSGRLRLHQP